MLQIDVRFSSGVRSPESVVVFDLFQVKPASLSGVCPFILTRHSSLLSAVRTPVVVKSKMDAHASTNIGT